MRFGDLPADSDGVLGVLGFDPNKKITVGVVYPTENPSFGWTKSNGGDIFPLSVVFIP